MYPNIAILSTMTLEMFITDRPLHSLLVNLTSKNISPYYPALFFDTVHFFSFHGNGPVGLIDKRVR